MSARIWTALILIAIGAALLLQEFGVTLPSRWWALLLFVPMALAVFGAWRTFSREGAVTLASAAPFAGAVVLLILTLAILADVAINWSIMGPIALIVVGVGLLTRRFAR